MHVIQVPTLYLPYVAKDMYNEVKMTEVSTIADKIPFTAQMHVTVI